MAMATEKHFSLVSKKASIWFFLTMASNLIQHWPLYYLDKKNVFHVIYRRKFTLEKPPSFVVWGKSQWAHKSLLQTQKQCPWVWLVCFKTLFKNLAWLMLMLLIWFSIRINPLSMNQPYLYGWHKHHKKHIFYTFKFSNYWYSICMPNLKNITRNTKVRTINMNMIIKLEC